MNRPPVTLQISLAPTDHRHARVLLPHQLKVWRDQVDEILLTVDLHRSPGHFSAGWQEGRDGIAALAASIPGARVAEVDYSPAARARIAAAFFGGRPVPTKDFRGGPFYSYFFALAEAAHDHVFHTDSDIFFGGGSPGWMDRALANMTTHPEVLIAAPLPGPPTADGSLRSQTGEPDPSEPNCFRFHSMTTRLFLLSRTRLAATVGALRVRRPPAWRNTLKALVEGHPAADLPEHLITAAMRARGLVRREFLGPAPGLWSLHPPYRTADFYDRLPELVRRVETGDVPEAQRGRHDMEDGMVDWSEAVAALRRNRWWRRWLRRK